MFSMQFSVSTISKNVHKRTLGLLGLIILGAGWVSTAHAAACDPVVEGAYGSKISTAAVYSSCTTTVSTAQHTVAIKYNTGGFIDTVVTLPGLFNPIAPASTASIGTLIEYKAQDMGTLYVGDCTEMKGRVNATPPAVSGHYYCFFFDGSAADLYLGGQYNTSISDYFSNGVASIVSPPTANDFITTWQTDNSGTSNSTSITVPMVGGPFDVDWDNDGFFDDLGLSGSATNDYGVAGTYTIRIRGTYDSISFNNGGDKRKILSIDQWGTNTWTSMWAAFYGAANLTVPATDTPDFSAVTNMWAMFSGAALANPNTSSWDTANVTDMGSMFAYASLADPDTSSWSTSKVTTMWTMFTGAASANPVTSSWDTSLVTNMAYMFNQATSFDQDIGSWDVTSLTDATEMFTGVALSIANYESLLTGWDAQVLQSGVTFSGGDSTYCHAPAIAARANMIASDSWVITDGGPVDCAPLNPLIAPDLTPATDTGGSDSDDITTVSTPVFYVNCSLAGNVITLYTDNPAANTEVGDRVCTTVGEETALVTTTLAVGTHNISYTDKAGALESGHSPALGITVIPPVPGDDFVTTWQTDNPGTSDSLSITVPMVGGPFDVDWGDDGVFEETGLYGPQTHDFLVAGTYTIRIRGSYDSIKFNNGGDKEKILSVDQWGTNTWTTMAFAFRSASNLQVPAIDTPNFSMVTSMGYMFSDAALADPDTSGWDTSAVTNMSYMFYKAYSANPDTSGWDTSAVIHMYYMFYDIDLADPDTSGWDTSAVTSMRYMFWNTALANPNTSGWDTSAVTRMEHMFYNAELASPDTSGWDTSAVTDMASMFYGATLANPDTSGWDTSEVTDMSRMFYLATLADPDTSNWNTAAVTDMWGMFYGADSAIPVTDGWDTSEVTDMSYMFGYADLANPITTNWDTSAVTEMQSMFREATSASPDTSGWVTAAVTDMHDMFYNADLADPVTTSWDTSEVTDMSYMFYNNDLANPDTSGWNTSAVTDMSYMFYRADLADPVTTSWDTAVVTDMSYMFYNADSANPVTTSWNTALVTDMSSMFSNTDLANPNVSSWDTAAVTNMSSMFAGAASFDQNVGSWNVTSLTDATDMFTGIVLSLANYESLLAGWDTQVLQAGVTFSGGDSTYCSAPAIAARANMISSDSWVITDGGEHCPPATPATAPDLTPATDTGEFDNDDITTDSTPGFYVECSVAGYFITLYTDNPVANTKIGTHRCKSAGTKTATATTALDIGVHNISYTDGIGGSVSGHSPTLQITIEPPVPTDDFVTTWQTDNPGTSSSTSITVPMVDGPYEVDWNNDGVFDESGLSGLVTHDYGVAGTYTIRIRGAFTSVSFINGGDGPKILSLDQWGTHSWASMYGAFLGAENLTVPATDTPDFSAVSDMSGMFYNAALANPDTKGWDTAAVISMSTMFYGATSANPDASGWDTAAVTSMWKMFYGATFADPDTSGWDTAAVTNMSYMFYGATSADPDTSGWDTAAVTSMSYMFYGATSADPDTSGWDTSAVTTMWSMFEGATSANPIVSGWNTAEVWDMEAMFSGAISFDRNIGSWNVAEVSFFTNMFLGVTLSTANYDSLLVGWDAQVLKSDRNFHGGNSTYCSEAAIAARANMIATDLWVITDGGQECPPVLLDNIFTNGFED